MVSALFAKLRYWQDIPGTHDPLFYEKDFGDDFGSQSLNFGDPRLRHPMNRLLTQSSLRCNFRQINLRLKGFEND